MESSLTFNCRHRYPSGFTLDASFEAGGKVTALFGPSGSGKSTIVALIAGLLKPQHGLIELGQDVMTDTESRVFWPPERRRVGLLFQDNCLFPHLRVRANIAYGIHRRGGQGIPLERVVKTLELENLLNRRPKSLSGGEQQRVALARAIVAAPRLLLLDEPLTAVEASLRDRISLFIERVVQELEIPTLLVSHNRGLVDRMAAQVIYLENGRTFASAKTSQATASQAGGIAADSAAGDR
ncbi:MAG: ATP-binding cassette domain-containing protein [Pirellulaceae bacterium]|nr:ATP-binding cassette domain-containing protein [Pirellulaceae bacterium]